MKLRSAEERRGSPQGSSVWGECVRGKYSEAVGKRKRRMSKGKIGNDDDEVSEFGEGVYGGRQADKDGKERVTGKGSV